MKDAASHRADGWFYLSQAPGRVKFLTLGRVDCCSRECMTEWVRAAARDA